MPMFTGNEKCQESIKSTAASFEDTHTWLVDSWHMSQLSQTDRPLRQGPLQQAEAVELLPVVIAWLWILAEEVSVRRRNQSFTPVGQ